MCSTSSWLSFAVLPEVAGDPYVESKAFWLSIALPLVVIGGVVSLSGVRFRLSRILGGVLILAGVSVFVSATQGDTATWGVLVALVCAFLMFASYRHKERPENNKPVESNKLSQPARKVILTRKERTLMTLCPVCRAPIARAATKCLRCGESMDGRDLANRPSIQELIDRVQLAA